MTPAERQRRYRASRKPGYCGTCVKRKALAGKTKCRACYKVSVEAAYLARGLTVEDAAKRKRRKK